MARESNKKKAQMNKALWDRANNLPRVKWQTNSQQGYDFYLNQQLTSEEEKALKESGMPTFIINRITPVIEIMRYFTTANSPRWKAVGAEGSDSEIAQVHSDIADYCWNLSNGKSVYSQVILDSLTKGIGYFFVDVDKDADRGMGEVVFKRLEPYDVYVDPMSRDFLFRDASFISVRKNLSKSQLMVLFPDHKAKIKKAEGQSAIVNYSQTEQHDSEAIRIEDISNAVTKEGEEDEILPFFECYSKVKVPLYNLTIQIPLTKQELAKIKEQVEVSLKEYSQEIATELEEKKIAIGQQLEEGAIIEDRAALELEKAEKESQQKLEQYRQMLMSKAQEEQSKTTTKIVTEKQYNILIQNRDFESTIIDQVKFFQTRIKVTCSVGEDTFLYEYILPYEHYPIVPIPYTYTGTPFPMSAVLPLVGKQQEINKAHQIMIHNANLASNLRWLYEEGSIPEDEWEQYSSAAGALLKYRQGFQPPTPVQPAAINNAFYSITQEGKGDVEYISGVHSSMMGVSQAQPETYRGLLANDEYGTRRIKAWMGSIVEPALEHLGRCFKEIAQTTYTVNKVFRVVHPEAGKGDDERKSEINIPIYNDYGEAIGKWLDYEAARFDIKLVAGATMPVNRWALLEEYFRWFQSGLIDDIAMLAETDVRNKKQIIERKSLYSQLQSQISQLEEQVKDERGTVETLSRQLVQAGIKGKINEKDVEERKTLADTKAQQKLYKGLMKQDFDEYQKRKKQAESDKK